VRIRQTQQERAFLAVGPRPDERDDLLLGAVDRGTLLRTLGSPVAVIWRTAPAVINAKSSRTRAYSLLARRASPRLLPALRGMDTGLIEPDILAACLEY
jgi:hypothetical protein